MDYEKKYNEALERAKGMWEQGMMPERIKFIFPELKESEDERIKNVIYCVVRDNKDVKRILEGNGVSVDNALAYLEKQKEQKPAEWSEEDELMIIAIIQTLETFVGRGTTRMQIDWLKALRPFWKPSKEQMLALKNSAYGVYQNGDGPALRELYEQLKKL